MGRNFLSSKRIQGGAKKTSGVDLRAAEGIFAKRGFAGTAMRTISRPVPAVDPLFLQGKRELYNQIKPQMILRFDAFGPTPSGFWGNDE
jgi:hypothetical protein